jgi:hypothetical protein
MTIGKAFFMVLSVCTVLSAADSTTTKSKPLYKVTNGNIVVVDTVNNVLVVNEGNVQDTFVFTGKTIFSRYSAPINKTMLLKNDNVTVHYREMSGSKTANRVVVRDKQANATSSEPDSSTSQ